MMCQTELISKSIVRISKRSFAHRLDMLDPNMIEHKGALTRLNNQLDSLYDLLYGSYPTMTESDYQIIAPYLSVLLQTLNGLSEAYNKFDNLWLKEGKERLQMNISAIEEIDHDIRNFKINLRNSPRYIAIVTMAKSL